MTTRGCWLLVLLTLALWAGPASTVFAHGVLERSSPPAWTSLDVPPQQITLWFSEPVDPGLSAVTLLDAAGSRHGGPGSVSPDGRRMTVPVTALPRGVYTVRWRVLSMVDGHVTSGNFMFGIGQAPPGAAAGIAGPAPEPVRAILRWLSLLGALLLTGIVLFQLGVLRPGLDRLDSRDPEGIGAASARLLWAAAVTAAVILVLSVAGEFLVQAALLLDAPWGRPAADGRLFALLVGTKAGWSALVRGGTAVLMLIALARHRRTAPAWTTGIASAVLLAGFPLTAHAAGRGVVGFAADWLHLLAAAIWIGGLTGLLIAIRAAPAADRLRLARVLLPRFSWVAAGGLATVTLTGAAGAWLHIPEPRALIATAYGRTLLLKIALVVPLTAIGAWNWIAVRSRLRGSGDTSSTAFPRIAAATLGEMAVAAAIVAIAAGLTLTPPPRPAGAAAPTPLLFAGMAGDMHVALTIASTASEWHRLDVVVTDARGRRIAEGARVLVRLMTLDDDLDPIALTLAHLGQGRYRHESTALGLPGFWYLEVIVRLAGRLDVSTAFPLRLGARPAASTDPVASALFEQARAAVAALRSWRELQQLSDGTGSAYLTWLEAVRPDRQRFKTSSGVEVIALGTDRYQRTGGGPWKRYVFSTATRVEGAVYYMRDARAIRMGRALSCDVEPCRVLLWTSPDGGAEFAAWIGGRSHRVYTLLMLEPTHYMTLHFSDFNRPLRIERPVLP